MPPADDLFGPEFLFRLERLRLQTRRIHRGGRRAERRSRRIGSSQEFADYRDYAPGDDPRRIDWSIFGRVERLMMRLYEEEEDLDIAILVDCSASMRWKPQTSRGTGKFTLARQIAAALAYLGLHGLDRVGLWYFDHTLRGESGYLRGRKAVHEVLRFLRTPPGEMEATDLAASLGRFARAQKRRGLAIVLTDALDPAGFAPGLSALTGRHFSLHLLQILDPAERHPGQSGDLLLRDCENGLELPLTAGPKILQAYQAEVERFLEEIKTWCARRNAGYSLASSDDAFDDTVLRLLRQSRLVG